MQAEFQKVLIHGCDLGVLLRRNRLSQVARVNGHLRMRALAALRLDEGALKHLVAVDDVQTAIRLVLKTVDHLRACAASEDESSLVLEQIHLLGAVSGSLVNLLQLSILALMHGGVWLLHMGAVVSALLVLCDEESAVGWHLLDSGVLLCALHLDEGLTSQGLVLEDFGVVLDSEGLTLHEGIVAVVDRGVVDLHEALRHAIVHHVLEQARVLFSLLAS